MSLDLDDLELARPGWITARRARRAGGRWRAERIEGGWQLVCDYGERVEVVRPVNAKGCQRFGTLDGCRAWLVRHADTGRFEVAG